MVMSLKEGFSLFCEKHTSVKIGLSKFCHLCPRHIKTFDHIAHNVCVCAYHENLTTSCGSSWAYQLSVNLWHFCWSSNLKQWNNVSTVHACKNSLYKFVPSSDNNYQLVKYFQWQTTPRAEKIEMIGIVQEIFEELEDHLKGFLLHRYMKRTYDESLK